MNLTMLDMYRYIKFGVIIRRQILQLLYESANIKLLYGSNFVLFCSALTINVSNANIMDTFIFCFSGSVSSWLSPRMCCRIQPR